MNQSNQPTGEGIEEIGEKVDGNLPRQLSVDYEPNEYDVICARGNAAKRHAGNVRYRKLIQEKLAEYDKAPTKCDKSVIVLSILHDVQGRSPEGGFIKKYDDRWYVVSDSSARERIGQK